MDTKNITLKMPETGSTDLYFYKDVCREDTCDFINKLNKLNQELNELEDKNYENAHKIFPNLTQQKYSYPITVHMNTPGGECYSGFAMSHVLTDVSKNRPVYIRINGFCASMGIILLLSVPLEYRQAYADTTFMIHQVSSFAWDKVADMKEHVDEAERINNRLFDIILKETKITKERMNECYATRQDWFITADEALELGLISKII